MNKWTTAIGGQCHPASVPCKGVLDFSFRRNMEVAVGPRDWENPAVFNRNKCRSHVPLRAFPSQEAALQYYISGPATRDAPNVQVLNSDDWAFQLYDRPEKVPKGIQDPSFDNGQWGKASRASWSLIHRHSLCGAVVILFESSGMNFCHRINEGMRSHIP